MGIAPRTDLTAELAVLRAQIDQDAAAARAALADSAVAEEGASELAEHRQLHRRIAALVQRVARAEAGLDDPAQRRAELATLAYFAGLLRDDAAAWRTSRDAALAEHALRQAVARRDRERLARERERLLGRRDQLQTRVEQAAAQVARATGECRRTVPVIRLADTVTVCSITVSGPRRRFRRSRFWLVTLGPDRDQVLVRAE